MLSTGSADGRGIVGKVRATMLAGTLSDCTVSLESDSATHSTAYSPAASSPSHLRLVLVASGGQLRTLLL
jgi:hypothetical protein